MITSKNINFDSKLNLMPRTVKVSMVIKAPIPMAVPSSHPQNQLDSFSRTEWIAALEVIDSSVPVSTAAISKMVQADDVCKT